MPTIHLFTFITAGIGTVINGALIFLVLRRKPREQSTYFLAGWFVFLGFIIQIVGSLVITITEPYLALQIYQISTATSGLLTLFYLFVKKYLNIKAKSWVEWFAYTYILIPPVISIINPRFLVGTVSFDPNVQFFLANFNIAAMPLIYFGLLFWFYGIIKLGQAYRCSRSAIERNRLKYLILGGLLPILGMVLITVPIVSIRRYPLDMLGVTLGAVCLAYGVLRYQLLDITVIIRKGLLYSVLTTAVTGIYLFFAFAIQNILGATAAPVSLPAAFSTALVVAVVFQPLQNATQKLIDRVFFRHKYDSQAFIAQLSEVCASTLDLSELTESLVDSILKTLQIGKAGLFLVKRGTNRLQLVFSRGLPSDAEQIVFTTDRPLAQFLSQSDEVTLIYDLQDKKIPFEDLDKEGLQLLVPLSSRGRLRGVLALGPKLSEEIYSLEELNLLQTAADPAALALENAQLFTQIREEKERVEKLLADGE